MADVAGAARGLEALDELGANTPQQEVDAREILHLALDDEGKAWRQISKKDDSVDVAGVVGNDNTVALRQFFESTDADRHACQQERCPGRSGYPAAPALEPGQEQSEQDAGEYAQDKGEPGVDGEQKSAGSEGRWRVKMGHLLLFFAAAGRGQRYWL